MKKHKIRSRNIKNEIDLYIFFGRQISVAVVVGEHIRGGEQGGVERRAEGWNGQGKEKATGTRSREEV